LQRPGFLSLVPPFSPPVALRRWLNPGTLGDWQLPND
jgi:hypothetical protein